MAWSRVQLPGAQHMQWGAQQFNQGMQRIADEDLQRDAMDQRGGLAAQQQGMDAMGMLSKIAADKDALRREWEARQKMAGEAQAAQAGESVLDRAARLKEQMLRDQAAADRLRMQEEGEAGRATTRDAADERRHKERMASERGDRALRGRELDQRGSSDNNRMLQYRGGLRRNLTTLAQESARIQRDGVKEGMTPQEVATALASLNDEAAAIKAELEAVGGGGETVTPPPDKPGVPPQQQRVIDFQRNQAEDLKRRFPGAGAGGAGKKPLF